MIGAARAFAPRYFAPRYWAKIGLTVLATGVTLIGPRGGASGVISAPFTVGLSPAGSQFGSTVTVTPSDGGAGGTFTPTTRVLAADTAGVTGTFTYTPGSDGTVTISVTNNRSLTNPASLTYTSPLKAGSANLMLLGILGGRR